MNSIVKHSSGSVMKKVVLEPSMHDVMWWTRQGTVWFPRERNGIDGFSKPYLSINFSHIISINIWPAFLLQVNTNMNDTCCNYSNRSFAVFLYQLRTHRDWTFPLTFLQNRSNSVRLNGELLWIPIFMSCHIIIVVPFISPTTQSMMKQFSIMFPPPYRIFIY